ncbi:MAG: DNA topoisomerase, partial [Bacteroidetes bacterium QH_2_63_10]
PLQTRFPVNLTCLVPEEGEDIPVPRQVGLTDVIRRFLDHRMDVLTRRLRHDLEKLEKRIHLLRGFEIIFDALGEAIKIIRSSQNKSDSSQRLRHRFSIDERQADAILETKLYRLSQMEIDAVREELEDKEAKAEELRALLGDEHERWKVVKKELRAVRDEYGDDRRTQISGPDATVAYDEEDYILDEDAYVIVPRDGWVKRQGSGSTRATVGFFTNYGRCYTARIAEINSTTGYGDPVQKLFNFDDGEHVVGAVSFDERALPAPRVEPEAEPDMFSGQNGEDVGETVNGEPPYVVAISEHGRSVRFTTEGFMEPSTSRGRMFMRLEDGDEVVGAEVAQSHENVCLASRDGRVLIFPAHQISVYKGIAKGVKAITLGGEDHVIGFCLSDAAREGLEVETNRGRREIVRTTKYDVTSRAGKGRLTIKRGHLAKVFPKPTEVRLNGAE